MVRLTDSFLSSTGGLVLEIVKFLRNTHCTVFGSSPQRRLPLHYEDTLMICVNGSATGLSRSPDLTIMGAQIVKGSTKTCRHTLRNLNGRHTRRLILVHPGGMTDVEERFRDFGYSWDQVDVITKEQRADLVLAITGHRLTGLAGPHAPSNGVFAALLAAAAGASRIDLCGFSFGGGHFYISGDTPRNHVNVDKEVFGWLARNANVYSTDEAIRAEFGFKEIENPISPAS